MSLAYHSHPAVSNSNLSDLKRAANAQPSLNEIESLEDALKFGSLVDAMLTDTTGAHQIDKFRRSILDDRGEIIYYTLDQWELAEIMVIQAKADPLLKLFIDNALGQYAFIRRLNFQYDGHDLSIEGKCKFDLLSFNKKTGIEFKALSVTTQKQFEDGLEFFDYDRAGAYYMDLSRVDRYLIAGISKKTEKVFKYVIKPGDPMYLQGRKKWTYWANQWILKVENFNLI